MLRCIVIGVIGIAPTTHLGGRATAILPDDQTPSGVISPRSKPAPRTREPVAGLPTGGATSMVYATER